MGLKQLCNNLEIDFSKKTQAILPQDFIANKIKDLQLGSCCFAKPHALWIDEYNRCWLQSGFAQISYSDGIIIYDGDNEDNLIKIRKTEDGFEVTIKKDTTIKWQRTNTDGYFEFKRTMFDDSDVAIYNLTFE